MSNPKLIQLICPECGSFISTFADAPKPIRMRNSSGEEESFSKEDVEAVCNNCGKRVQMAIITTV